ncbi:3'-5' exonuclease [Thioalkalivibrio sp. HK1]|uniref:3'-5' exonuclease n=1 Tax=Thioalkalivibrio sp. HK1 TaxID=1469245 RepID=UPI00046E5A50|nr:3'-5' exonuclease [Thioalkalivibrio sp. HK1]
MSNTEIYISVDIEASGPFPPEYSMLSIGACVVGDIDVSFYQELKPIGERFLAKAIDIVGKPMKHFADCGQEPKMVMERFDEWIKSISHKKTPIFAGFNAAFDWAFVNWYFHTYLNKNPFGIAPIDTKSLFMGLTGGNWKDTRSSRIPDRFKGPLKQTHHALDDAKAQAQMFERIIERARERRQRDI